MQTAGTTHRQEKPGSVYLPRHMAGFSLPGQIHSISLLLVTRVTR